MKNEIALLAEIRSPNVIALKHATKTKNNFYLAMELCNGGDLEGYRKARGGYLPELEARMILKQILRGLQKIKEQDVMHRDLKLANIMLHFAGLRQDICLDTNFDLKEYIQTFDFERYHPELCCKIADLGFARRVASDDLAETTCGTPLLMAPEVLAGKLYNHKADVWSIGCLYYELLTGFMPFVGTSYRNLQENMEKGIYKIPTTVKLSFACV